MNSNSTKCEQFMSTDFKGNAISAVKLDVSKAYDNIPELLQKFINENDISSWKKICEKIDYLYFNIGIGLTSLDNENNFIQKIKREVNSGKKLLFKPNLVFPSCINIYTHGEDWGLPICTEWTFTAAIMRWFHDNCNIRYNEMALAEGSTSTFVLASSYSKFTERKITTETVMEGKNEDFYGGWGFFFARKYLSEKHPISHDDDPMNGYKESLNGIYLPPGKSGNRLMVYDINKINSKNNAGRSIRVPDGRNFKKITIHKAIIGGNKNNQIDLEEYPGCVLINLPKLKMHSRDLITNATKNIGIGLYPSQSTVSNNPDDLEYSYEFYNEPSYKGKIPHGKWIYELDKNTYLPIKNKYGNYVMHETEGLIASQVDIIKAVLNQNVFMLHVSDAINIINISHSSSAAVKVPEGYIWLSLDSVALDLLAARYCFNNISLQDGILLKEENNWPTEFVQKVPIPIITAEGNNIITKAGFDSPLFRYDGFDYSESRGIGSQEYYIVGFDTITQTPLVSIKGHLGRLESSKFIQLITKTLYYNPLTFIYDLEKTALCYARSSDILTGSSIYNEIMNLFDENLDGVLKYDEKTRGIDSAFFPILAYTMAVKSNEDYGSLKGSFKSISYNLKYSNKNWNVDGHDFARENIIINQISLAYKLSNLEKIRPDLYIEGMFFGKGIWPSWYTVEYIKYLLDIYGSESYYEISLDSMYGFAFRYADKTMNNGDYTGGINQIEDNKYSINKYFEALSNNEEPLKFIMYVPVGYGKLNGKNVPNVIETKNKLKIFTVEFNCIW